MDHEYMNQSPTGNNVPNPEAYQYPPTSQPSASPEYQQAAYNTSTQPVYDANYGQYTTQPPYGGYNQPSAQAPYGGYNQPPAQTPYGGYNQPPAQTPYGVYGQPPYGAYSPAAAPQKSSRVLATLGMIFGIVGLSLSWFPFFNILALVLSIVGIPFSAIGKKSGSGKAIAGLITSIIGTIIAFFFFIGYTETGLY